MRQGALHITPPTRIGVKAQSPEVTDDARVQRLAAKLKDRDWAINPFALSDADHLYLKGRLMKVVQTMMGKAHASRIADMTEDTFWSVLSGLVRGKVHNVRQQAEALVKDICGNTE
jgi:hypothetical protein